MSEPVGLAATLGLVVEAAGPDEAVLGWDVAPRHLQPYGIVHGGVHCAVVETAAVAGATAWFGDRGTVTALHVATDFLRPVREGTRLTARATPVHRGRSQQLWTVLVTDSDGRPAARGEVRIQNVPHG